LLQLDKNNNNVSSPDLQLMLLPFGASSDAGAAYFNHVNLKNEVCKDNTFFLNKINSKYYIEFFYIILVME
jgi:hypothetical protein